MRGLSRELLHTSQAARRRFSLHFQIALPNFSQRICIVLQSEKVRGVISNYLHKISSSEEKSILTEEALGTQGQSSAYASQGRKVRGAAGIPNALFIFEGPSKFPVLTLGKKRHFDSLAWSRMSFLPLWEASGQGPLPPQQGMCVRGEGGGCSEPEGDSLYRGAAF